MSKKSGEELVAAITSRYRESNKLEKATILNEFVAVTGYHRKYAIGLLNGYPVNLVAGEAGRQGRRRVYTDEVREALSKVWEAANRICSKRLVPFLPDLVAVLERHGHLLLLPAVRERLLSISPATVDRLLAEVRRGNGGENRRGTTSSSTIKQQVPIRTFSEWEGALPGYTEADLVAHCGGDVSGSYLHTLTITDVVTGWTECIALLFRDQQMVLQGVRQAEEQMPVPLLAIDTDNGSEFLNKVLFDYCQGKPIIFTRSRPYKKNDQCYVEQKNGAIVRQFIGYERFEGVESCRILTELYRKLRLYVNFFQPSLKLRSKERVGSRVIKKYDQAQTPYQRILASDSVSVEIKDQLKAQFAPLDPLQLLTQIRGLQNKLWAYAYVGRTGSQLSGLHAPTPGQGTTLPPVSATSLEKLSGQPTIQTNGTDTPPDISPPAGEPAKEQNQRKYRRSRRQRRVYQGERWWRTRPDPFAEVWAEVQQQLEQTPDVSAKMLFEALQHQHPNQFSDGLLRTLQRRVRNWRMAYSAGRSKPGASEKVSLTDS